MKKLIVCLIFLISFANAIQCYNGKTYVDIPESKLSEVGYTKYNITHSSFDCKIAYKRYLKVKETKQVNVSYVSKDEKNEIKEFSRISYLLPICLLVIIICIIWIIKIAVQKEPQDLYSVVQKEPIKPENDSVKTEPSKFWNDLSKYSENLEQVKTETVKSWYDLSREYSENLIKLEEERQKKEKAYFDAIIGKNYPVKSVQKNNNTYNELLTKQEWYDFRNKVINDRGYICEFCKKKHNLQIHHKLYYKKPDKEKIEPWLYNIDEVLLLCDNCHKSIHKKNKIKVYYISYADYNNRKVGFYNEFNQNL